MLAAPDRPSSTQGFKRSSQSHNNEIETFADWVEAGSLVSASISTPEIVEFLTSSLVYEDDNFAWEFIGNVWSELARRKRLLGPAYPFEIDEESISAARKAPDYGYVFCLALSMPWHFKSWADQHVPPHAPCRALFEELCAEACEGFLPSWQIKNVGWSREQPLKKGDIVRAIADLLHSTVTDASILSRANDGGIDVLCHKPFSDGWGGYATVMMQCATGINDFRGKAGQPNLDLWRSSMNLHNMPKRAFSVPFALSRQEIQHLTAASNGTVLDRIRLLSWLSHQPINQDLKDRLDAWSIPAICSLPT